MTRSSSIRVKIIKMNLAVSAVIVVLTALLFSLFSLSILKSTQKESLLAELGFAAEYCVPSLLFDDPAGAVQVLQNYRAMPLVETAVLFDVSGRVFAEYNPRKLDYEFHFGDGSRHFAEYRKNRLLIAVPVNSQGEKIGELHASVSTSELYAMAVRIVTVIVVMIPILLFAAYLFASRLQRRISQPILALANMVSQFRYGEPIPTTAIPDSGIIETAVLTSRFQEMLERIQAGENELSQASAFLHTIVDSMPSLLIVADQDRKITLCNSQAEEYSTAASPLGMHLFTAFPFLMQFENHLETVISKGEKASLRAVPVEAGGMAHCDIVLFPLNNQDHPGAVIALTDVSELASKDQQLIQIQKMETVGVLAGGLAHDFNNIISGIVGTLSLMDYKEGDAVDVNELREYISLMNHAGDRAREMIDQLLTLSHKGDTRFAPVNLNDVLKHVVRFCEHTFDKQVKIQINMKRSQAFVMGNASQLEQVFLNLCINASHAMTIMRKPEEPQGGTLTITLDGRIAVLDEQSEKLVNCTAVIFEDTGVGIPPESLKQIFDPFFTTKEKGKGTGLGLSMVFNIVHQHGGVLTVDSVPGKGSVFTILLKPASSGALIKRDTSEIRAAVSGNGRTILVVDDDASIRMIAGKMLARMGFEIIYAVDGIDGTEQFQRLNKEIDAVILDMVMPGMSGKDVFLNMLRINPDVPVILSSGFSQDERVLNTIDLGAAAFVHKPYTLNELHDTLYRVLHLTA